MMRWYVAGPMRGIKYYNFPAFDKAEVELRDAGYEVFNPADIDRENGLDVNAFPADYDWRQLPDGMDLDAVIARDCDELATCDGIYMLAGWESSKGARAEHALAEWRGLDIVYEVDPVWHRTGSLSQLPETKDTNPKDAIGTRKAGIGNVPACVLMELGVAMKEGAHKYGAYNWRVAGVSARVYYEACLRHIMAWWEGEDIDPESPGKVSHVVKAMACLTVLRDARIQLMLKDDRPPASLPFMDAVNADAAAICDRYPTPVPPYTQKGLENGDC